MSSLSLTERLAPRDSTDRLCPLCRISQGDLFHQDRREYYRCPACALVFVLPFQFLSAEEEKSEYDLHENTADDPGYRRFLKRLFDPVTQCLAPGSCGLDFGAGPESALAAMFEEAGHPMKVYDPFYAPDPQLLQQSYDFIVASEVVEHLHAPRMELDRLWSCLNPGGTLGLMTKRVIDKEAFTHWHYIRDLTHVCFFSTETFQWLANIWDAELTVAGNDVVLLTKKQ